MPIRSASSSKDGSKGSATSRRSSDCRRRRRLRPFWTGPSRRKASASWTRWAAPSRSHSGIPGTAAVSSQSTGSARGRCSSPNPADPALRDRGRGPRRPATRWPGRFRGSARTLAYLRRARAGRNAPRRSAAPAGRRPHPTRRRSLGGVEVLAAPLPGVAPPGRGRSRRGSAPGSRAGGPARPGCADGRAAERELNSSSVAATAAAAGDLGAYSAAFPDHHEIDESQRTKRTAAALSVPLRLHEARAASVLDAAVEHADRWLLRPRRRTSSSSCRCSSWRAPTGWTRAGGQGGDELLAPPPALPPSRGVAWRAARKWSSRRVCAAACGLHLSPARGRRAHDADPGFSPAVSAPRRAARLGSARRPAHHSARAGRRPRPPAPQARPYGLRGGHLSSTTCR